MNQPDNILNELRELSPAVAGITRVNVFTVPDGYFESLTGSLLAGTTAGMAPQGAVPEGYFENLAGNILDRIKRAELKEHTESSTLLAGISRNNIFSTPAGYFENLPAKIMLKLTNAKQTAAAETFAVSELVAGIGNRNVLSVPTGYFENLQAGILHKMSQLNEVVDETASISTLVAGIGKGNIYQVPANYFEHLPEAIMQQRKPAAKVISMQSRTNVWKYAAAAVVTGIIAVSAFFMLNNNNNAASTSQVAVMKEADKIIETNSFDKELNSISDAAIVAFLENKGQNVEASLVASLVDDKNLPEADEYLLNDNTLDDILKTLDLNN